MLAVRNKAGNWNGGVGQGIVVSAIVDSNYNTLASHFPNIMSSVYLYLHSTSVINNCSCNLVFGIDQNCSTFRVYI